MITDKDIWCRISFASSKDCWIWQGKMQDGYGLTGLGGKLKYAHRWVYIKIMGEVPEGKVLDHLCRTRNCVNPFHLEPVTIGENVMRGDTIGARNVKKTHCPNGHPYDDTHTYWRKDRNGKGRHCRTCVNEKRRASRRKDGSAKQNTRS